MGLADRHYERYDEDRPPTGPRQAMALSPTVWIIGIHVLAFLICIVGSPDIKKGPGLHLFFSKPFVFQDHQLWRMLTYFLAEGNIIALVLNMFAFYFMARMLEMVWSWPRLVLCYLACVLGGSLAATIFVALINPKDSTLIGAAAPVLGIIVAAIFRFENLQGALPFSKTPFSLKTFLFFIIAIQVIFTVLGFSPVLLLAASAGSGITGYLWIRVIKEKNPIAGQIRRQSWFSKFLAERRQKKRAKEAQDLADLEVEVDRILDKVRRETLASLTEAEKRTLKRATDLKNK